MFSLLCLLLWVACSPDRAVVLASSFPDSQAPALLHCHLWLSESRCSPHVLSGSGGEWVRCHGQARLGLPLLPCLLGSLCCAGPVCPWTRTFSLPRHRTEFM